MGASAIVLAIIIVFLGMLFFQYAFPQEIIFTNNLAVCPNAWGSYNQLFTNDVAYGNAAHNKQIVHLETNQAYWHNNCISIRIDGINNLFTTDAYGLDYTGSWTYINYNQYREINTATYAVKPGDRILFQVWVKSNSDGSTPGRGSIIGCDLYGSSGRLFEVTERRNSNEFYYMNNLQQWTDDAIYVPYGRDWTLMTLDFIVPTVPFTQTDSGQTVPSQYANRLIAWMGMDWEPGRGTNLASGWFCNSKLNITSNGSYSVTVPAEFLITE